MPFKTMLFTLSIIWLVSEINTLKSTAQIRQQKTLKISPAIEITTIINNYSIRNNDTLIEFFHYNANLSTNQNLEIQPRILKNQIEIFENEMKPDIIDDLIYRLSKSNNPIILLINDMPKTYQDALIYTNSLIHNLKNDFWLMKFNSSGVSSVLAKSKPNLDRFNHRFREEMTKPILNNELGNTIYFAIIKASQLLPTNSTILVFSNKKSLDEDISQLTAYNLAQKSTKLYVIWTGESSDDIDLLKETALYTGGKFYYQNIQKFEETDMGFKQDNNTREVILVKNNNEKNQHFIIPIDRTIKNLDFIIKGSFTNVTFIAPNGYIVDLLNTTSLRKLSPGSYATHAPNCCHNTTATIRFNTAKVIFKPVIGIWELRIENDNFKENRYNLTIYAETDLAVLSQYNVQEHQKISTYSNENEINLKIKGDITKIEHISFLDSSGDEIQNVPLNIIEQMKIKEGLTTKKEQNYDGNIKISKSIPKSAYYIKINGTNNNDEIFSRLSYLNRDLQESKLPPIIIETSIRSELIGTPGSSPKIVFEVTNNRDQTVWLSFNVQDEKSLLQNLVPRAAWVAPKQTIEVTVSTYVPPRTALSFIDLITFMVSGPDKAQKQAMLYVSNERVIDNYRPNLYYKFTSNCMEVSYSSCQSGTWTIEVTAQDSESGLLQVTSNPPGLYVPNGYISGTKETVTSYYSSSCCQPYLEITAVDLNNNRRSYKTDAYKDTLSTGSIVAIVLGVILIIALIILIVFLIRKCYKKRQSLDLPRYRTQAETGTSRF